MLEQSKSAQNRAKKRDAFLQKGFELFSEKSIESVTLQDIADASGYGIATLYRYYGSKASLVVEIATEQWARFGVDIAKEDPEKFFLHMSGAEIFEYYLDAFVGLYRNNKKLLRFNQLFNIYIQTEKIDEEIMEPYEQVIRNLKGRFHLIYAKGEKDGTIRTDVPEEEMFSTTLHLMLAAVTRYAVGLVYTPQQGFNDEKELELQKQMLYKEFVVPSEGKER